MAPWVHANFATTLDGCLGTPGSRLYISNQEDKARVHQLRNRMDAILVGVGTVLADDPKLTVNPQAVDGPVTNPVRIIVDPSARAPSSARIFDDQAPTVSVTRPDVTPPPGRDCITAGTATDGTLDLSDLLQRLKERGLGSVLVEGGPRTLGHFFGHGLVDECTVFLASWTLGQADAVRLEKTHWVERAGLLPESAHPLGDGFVARWVR